MADTSTVNPTGFMETDVPFQICIFTAPFRKGEAQLSSAATWKDCVTSDQASYWSLFPASFRTGKFREKAKPVNQDSLDEFLAKEFSLQRLDDIYSKLWRVGYPRAPRSLSAQLLQGRRVVLTQNLDMHLVWDNGKIFIKPLPRYLLEPAIWRAHLPKQGQPPLQVPAGAPFASLPPPRAESASKIREGALGLLYTYACLITDRADFEIALREDLLPKIGGQPSWSEWRVLATELLSSNITDEMHRRFRHGELRLDRLNWIYIFKDIPSFEMYFNPWSSYTGFVVKNVAWITVVTVYMVVVLTAMQVGLATERLNKDSAFQRASYGFAVFSILAPLIALLLITVALSAALVPNWKSARAGVGAARTPNNP